MTIDDVVPLLIPLTFVSFLVLERVFPARPLPHVPWWLAKGIAAFFVVGAVNGIVPAVILGAIGDVSLFHLRWLGTVGGAVLVLLVSDPIGYAIHRGLHTLSDPVWRWTHQLHHSAERMDVASASWFHPLDIVAQQVIPTVLIALALGVSPSAAALGGFLGFLCGVSPHLNVRTPAWLGYVIQRPEMHAVHHTRGVHAYNYGVLAFSDLLFGTWRNPATFPRDDYGFWDGASSHLGAMLVGRDVSTDR
jgi:sterol desaturase/sphingolipid hydroxylase (fatty acid hydroxylase superfamily)